MNLVSLDYFLKGRGEVPLDQVNRAVFVKIKNHTFKKYNFLGKINFKYLVAKGKQILTILNKLIAHLQGGKKSSFKKYQVRQNRSFKKISFARKVYISTLGDEK